MYNTRICGAFITFETDIELKKAVSMINSKPHNFEISTALEPCIYIWENLAITKKE
jgi:hypothetical protein